MAELKNNATARFCCAAIINDATLGQ